MALSFMMIVLLLFLQKQNLAYAVYQFGSVLSLPDYAVYQFGSVLSLPDINPSTEVEHFATRMQLLGNLNSYRITHSCTHISDVCAILHVYTRTFICT
jgi:hypothetical protein